MSDRFQCLICHQTALPTSANLNPFGTAFQQNGSQWNAQLAAQSADADNCSNGFELGDENGDGTVDDVSLSLERYNPGSDDCALQIQDSAWGALKKLFQ
jgi:hypothetical protein